jgi:TonB family protein
MHDLGTRGAAHKARLARVVAGTLLLASAYTASAQGNPPAGSTDTAPSEAARRAALSPYRFILQSSTAPRKPAPAPAAPAATPAVAESKKPAPAAPVHQAAFQPNTPAEAVRTLPPTAAPAGSAAAPAPAPEATVTALARKPPEPPMRREIIPLRTDDPRLTPALMREAPHGAVTIEFDIQTDGSVGDVKVVSSSNRALNRATTEAVKGWKFEPVDEVLTVRTEVVYNLDR